MKDFKTLVTEHFKIEQADITDALSAKDIPEWDSMNYLLFISDVEKEYNVSFSMDEVLGAQTLGDIRRMLEARTHNL
jgi:acyl carrier protein